MITFAMRNLRLYFRDKAGVFFSLLAVFIIIALYSLFLGDTLTSGFRDLPGADFLMDSWIMAGLLAVTAVTTTLGAVAVVVNDSCGGIAKDFYTSPLKRSSLVGGYLISTNLVGLIMSLLALFLAETYIVSRGGSLLPVITLFKMLAVIVLSTLSSAALMFFLATLFRTQNAFAVASAVLGTLIGFLMGIYVPIGVLPAGVQTVIKVFPISHAPVIFRRLFMEAPLAVSFANVPAAAVTEFQLLLGIVYEFKGKILSIWVSVLILISTTLLFFVLGVLRMLAAPKR